MTLNISVNYRVIIKILGIITFITGVSMLPALLCAYIYREPDCIRAFLISSLAAMAIGGLVTLLVHPSKAHFHAREGYIVVALCWIIASFIGAFPYVLSGFSDTFICGFFESTSGFTTTGCTVSPISEMPHALMMWKAIAHWLGGMGILVFVISLMPALGINGQVIARAEAPGPVLQKVSVRMSDSAKILYITYISLTVIEFLLLCCSRSMTVFDALINTLGSISTGGLAAHPGGIAYYNSLFVEIVICVFMILASVNFVLYHYAVTRKWQYVFKDLELKAFLLIIAVGTILTAIVLRLQDTYTTIGSALRDSFFQVVSFATTCGYCSADYTHWPVFCQTILFMLLFVGGCTASTSGSIKVIRIIVMLKLIRRGVSKRIHPRSVVSVKMGDNGLPAPVVSGITVFIFMYMALFLFSCLVLSLQNLDLETTISTAAGMLSNTGEAFGAIGGSANFSMFSDPLKLYLSLLMIVGRLELFTIVILFTRSFWGRER